MKISFKYSSFKYLSILIVVIGLLVLWLINIDYFSPENKQPHPPTALELAGIDCEAISEKSVINLVAVVPYQQLEIAGRKARVLLNCISDHGYVQNNAWQQYATPIANNIAKEQHISFDEAYEHLRRSKMLVFSPIDAEPMFWIKNTQSHLNKP